MPEQLTFRFPLVKSKEELMKEYDDAIANGPQELHTRLAPVRPAPLSQEDRMRQLQKLLTKLQG